jgi:hypothetical protein
LPGDGVNTAVILEQRQERTSITRTLRTTKRMATITDGAHPPGVPTRLGLTL